MPDSDLHMQMQMQFRPDGERIAVLETQMMEIKSDISAIRGSVDQLLELKTKGMGALWLVGLVLGSGLLGVVTLVMGFFSNRPHL